MGQYFVCANISKKEFIHPHKLGCGLKAWEILAGDGIGRALVVLCTSLPEQRGGGDLDLSENWHGPERTDFTKVGDMPEEYPEIARRTIGRWSGDKIALIGDYAEFDDLEGIDASKIWEKCEPKTKQVYTKEPIGDGEIFEIRDMTEGEHYGMWYHFKETAPAEYKDVSDDVCRVIEHELQGKFTGTGWRTFEHEGTKT